MNRSIDAPFGELLQNFRSRCHLTQTALATAIGVHRNTVGRWERGEVLPDTRAMVLELARLLHLAEQDTRRLLEASLTATSPYWTVPHPRNPAFTGREAILEQLHRVLSADQPIASTICCALCGLGGIGKTQVAVEYAYRHALEYSAVFWLGAENPERMMAGYLAIAETLQLPERRETDQGQAVAAVQRWLAAHQQWLLICDNVEDVDQLHPLLPVSRQGAVLLTTQRQTIGNLTATIELPKLSQDAGVAFLLQRAKAHARHSDPAKQSEALSDADELVTLLGGLPLALDQAGAYIEEVGCSIADYLQRYEKSRSLLLSRRGVAGGQHPAPVSTTLGLVFEQIERRNPLAAKILRMCAFLHPDAIPEELLATGASQLEPELASIAADPVQWDMMIAALRSFSLITRNPDTQSIALHRLVQVVLRDTMEANSARQWAERIIRAVNSVFPVVSVEAWPTYERYLAHAQICRQMIERESLQTPEAAELLDKTGYYLFDRGRYQEAELYLAQAVALREQCSGPEHIELATALDHLAQLFVKQGCYQDAEPLLQRALALRERYLGPEHPLVAEILVDLNELYFENGDYEQAETLSRRALAIRERYLGPDHPETAECLSDLALDYWKLGKYALGEPMARQALTIYERQLGPTHASVPNLIMVLATLCRSQGKHGETEQLCERALAIREQVLGPDHPSTALALSNLATIYREQGKLDRAERLYRRALIVNEQQLGPTHIRTAVTLRNLAQLAQQREDYEQAEPLYRRALAICEQQFGMEHAEVAKVLVGLATLSQQQEDHEQAKQCYERALFICERQLGRDHPETIQVRNNYSLLLQGKGHEAGAEQ